MAARLAAVRRRGRGRAPARRHPGRDRGRLLPRRDDDPWPDSIAEVEFYVLPYMRAPRCSTGRAR